MFKDKHYYIRKLKEYAGLAASAIIFALFILWMFAMA